jgi:hypothetical protein
MFLTAICPTFRHPKLLANTLAMWNLQTYPADQRKLLILDDGDTFDNQQGDNWVLLSTKNRLPALSMKCNTLLSLALKSTDAIMVWDDDDIYMPSYVETHAKTLEHHDLSKTLRVLTDCGPGNTIKEEDSGGRFHSSLGFTKELILRVGGWKPTKRADFDLQLIDRLTEQARSWGKWEGVSPIPYVYRWNTGHAHCQWTMTTPEDETWYDKGEEAYVKVPRVGTLVPKLDDHTAQVLKEWYYPKVAK